MAGPVSAVAGAHPRGRGDRAAARRRHLVRPAVEAVEPRRLLSVSLDAGGWTVVTPPGDAHVIYVSSGSGDNQNDGLSVATPVRTIAAAAALVSDGSGDQLLLKCGDTWHESFGTWAKSGRSASEPLVIGSYGSGARPIVATGAGQGFTAGAKNGPLLHDVDLIGIDFWEDGRDPATPDFKSNAVPTGLFLRGNVQGVLIEDCRFRFYGVNIDLQQDNGPISDITVRRSIVVDAYSTTATSQGMYADGVQGLTLEQDLFDHNGWNESVAGADPEQTSHDVYITAHSDGLVARGNIFSNASAHGLQARPGGIVVDNVFLNDPTGLSFGLVNNSPIKAGGIVGYVNGNVFLGQRDLDGAARGTGIEVSNTRPLASTVISNNIFTHAPDAAKAAVQLSVGFRAENAYEMVGLNDLLVTRNIVYKWGAGFFMPEKLHPNWKGGSAVNRVRVVANDFQHIVNNPMLDDGTVIDPVAQSFAANRYQSDASGGSTFRVVGQDVPFDQWASQYEPDAQNVGVSYADPERTASSYGVTLAAAGLDGDFIAAARMQSHQAWRGEYMAAALIGYIRGGFEEIGAAAGHDWTPHTPPRVQADVPFGVQAVKKKPLIFTLHYTDDRAVDPASVDVHDLRLINPKGKELKVKRVTMESDGSGGLAATYTFRQGRAWRKADEGTYSLALRAGEVRDTEGAATVELPLGQIQLVRKVPAPQPTPVHVEQVTFVSTPPQSISFRFNVDIADTTSYRDFELTRIEDSTLVDGVAADFTVIYDPQTFTSTWTFPGLPGGALPAGTYHMALSWEHLVSKEDQRLDGNRDGVGGDDYVSPDMYVST